MGISKQEESSAAVPLVWGREKFIYLFIYSLTHLSIQAQPTLTLGTKGQLCQEFLVQLLVPLLGDCLFIGGIQPCSVVVLMPKGDSRSRQGQRGEQRCWGCPGEIPLSAASTACSRITPEMAFLSLLLWLWSPALPFSYSAQNPKGAGLTMNKFPWQFDINGQDLWQIQRSFPGANTYCS